MAECGRTCITTLTAERTTCWQLNQIGESCCTSICGIIEMRPKCYSNAHQAETKESRPSSAFFFLLFLLFIHFTNKISGAYVHNVCKDEQKSWRRSKRRDNVELRKNYLNKIHCSAFIVARFFLLVFVLFFCNIFLVTFTQYHMTDDHRIGKTTCISQEKHRKRK